MDRRKKVGALGVAAYLAIHLIQLLGLSIPLTYFGGLWSGAESQGRQFQAVLDEALRDYIERQQKDRPRRHVMVSLASSLDEFDSLYRELAK